MEEASVVKEKYEKLKRTILLKRKLSISKRKEGFTSSSTMISDKIEDKGTIIRKESKEWNGFKRNEAEEDASVISGISDKVYEDTNLVIRDIFDKKFNSSNAKSLTTGEAKLMVKALKGLCAASTASSGDLRL